MSTYAESGVNIEKGDQASRLAYEAAKRTFPGRKGMIGEPVLDEGGFAGALDMGDFYLIQNDDGVGSKIQIAEQTGIYEGLGYDLLAMVADDAICVGAETISLTNTLDVDKVDPEKVGKIVSGLEKACLEQKVVVPGGEIAELGNMVNGYLWNATAVGIVEKHKLINGENIQPGDQIIALRSAGFRSNGFSLVRHILSKKFGEDWAQEMYDDEQTWGQVTLTPSVIYSNFVLDLHGRYKQEAKVELKGVVHVTGGGIPGNLPRVLNKKQLGAHLHNLPKPQRAMIKVAEMGGVAIDEAYRTWNMGTGMFLISNDTEKILELAAQHGIEAQVAGEVTDTPEITLE
jgi:phosphoribosylformylglycinamidine cyclo-ligase